MLTIPSDLRGRAMSRPPIYPAGLKPKESNQRDLPNAIIQGVEPLYNAVPLGCHALGIPTATIKAAAI